LAVTIFAPAYAGDAPQQKGASNKAPRADADTSTVRPQRPADKIVVFKPTPQGELKLHFYFPVGWTASDQRQAMVFWSGGAFKQGGAGQFLPRAEYFSSRGLVTVCAEYRVKDTHGTLIDKCAEDARSAMRWIKGHATELGVAKDKVIAAGGSAGGTLALLAAREQGPNGKDDDLSISPRPCALVLFNPAVGEYVLTVIGRGGEEQAAVNAQVVALNTPQKVEPPVIMFFGSEDRIFLEVSSEFCRKAQAQGLRCELWIAAGMGHGFFNREPWHTATTRKADEFLASLGYITGPSGIADNPAAVLTRFVPPGRPAD
jgi:acetyl esterase/lipase